MAFQKGRTNVPHLVRWTDPITGLKMVLERPTKGQARSLLREKRKSDPNAYMERK